MNKAIKAINDEFRSIAWPEKLTHIGMIGVAAGAFLLICSAIAKGDELPIRDVKISNADRVMTLDR